jgi:hypothetical protein
LLLTSLAIPADAVVRRKPDAAWQADGRVYAVARAGNRIYLAGDFKALTDGHGHSVPRTRLAALDASTGAPINSWTPNASGIVRAIEPSADGSEIFIGGDFDSVNGQSRHRLAAIRASDGGTVRDWSPTASGGSVYSVKVYGGTVYVGGGFTSVSGTKLPRLAAIDARTGSPLHGFDPQPDATVRGVSVSPDGGIVYLGGKFSHVNGASRRNAAAVDASSGAVKSWSPDPGYPLLDIVATSTGVYLAGAGGGGTLGAFDAVPSDSKQWEIHSDGNFQAVGVLGDTVYGGGHFDKIGTTTRHKILAVTRGSGHLESWDPGANSSVGVRGLLGYGNKLYMTGDFTSVAGSARKGFAQFTDPGL